MENKGRVHIYTGDGKGKTTAAVGLATRAAGWGQKVLFVQFFKEDSAPSGEKEVFRDLLPTVELIRSNCRHPFFTGDKTDKEDVKSRIRATYEEATEKAGSGEVDLLVLDEVMGAVKGGWIGMEELLEFLCDRPPGLEVALTGRDAPPELVKNADYVTEMLMIKHPFNEGHSAKKGVEF